MQIDDPHPVYWGDSKKNWTLTVTTTWAGGCVGGRLKAPTRNADQPLSTMKCMRVTKRRHANGKTENHFFVYFRGRGENLPQPKDELMACVCTERALRRALHAYLVVLPTATTGESRDGSEKEIVHLRLGKIKDQGFARI